MRQTIAAIAVAAGLTAGCASTPEAPAGPPDYTPLTGQAASAHARLYADCIAQAAGTRAYVQLSDGGEELILFTCTGTLARTFYDALATHSAAIGSQFEHDGATVRSTARIVRNLIGVDYCAVTPAGAAKCVLTFNAGDFIQAP